MRALNREHRTPEDLITISETDLFQIRRVLSNRSPYENLELELERANVVVDSELPEDLVRMHSTVKFRSVQEARESTFTLVFPEDADVDTGNLSVLSPLGSALLGLRVGQRITWTFSRHRTRTLEILEVL